MNKPEIYTLRVLLNGTDVNPFEKLGTSCNPFPAVPIYEFQGSTMALQRMCGPKIESADEIRRTLKGAFTDEFVEYIAGRFRPGELVKFRIQFFFEGNQCIGWREQE